MLESPSAEVSSAQEPRLEGSHAVILPTEIPEPTLAYLTKKRRDINTDERIE